MSPSCCKPLNRTPHLEEGNSKNEFPCNSGLWHPFVLGASSCWHPWTRTSWSGCEKGAERCYSTMSDPHSDLKPLLFRYIKGQWQNEWDNHPNNKLYTITSTVGKSPQKYMGSRREQVILTRCRIGHSYLTYVCLLKREPFPECLGCQCPLTLNHI
jgi:hypothetical protein